MSDAVSLTMGNSCFPFRNRLPGHAYFLRYLFYGKTACFSEVCKILTDMNTLSIHIILTSPYAHYIKQAPGRNQPKLTENVCFALQKHRGPPALRPAGPEIMLLFFIHACGCSSLRPSHTHRRYAHRLPSKIRNGNDGSHSRYHSACAPTTEVTIVASEHPARPRPSQLMRFFTAHQVKL